MYSLFIDNSFNDICICLYKDGKVESQEFVSGQKYNSQFIMPTIKKILNDIIPDEIIVCNGPGSFTGVRLGVTVAKALAYTLNIPIYTVSSLEMAAVSTDVDPKIVSVNDNNDYYVSIFDQNNQLVGDYEYLKKDNYSVFCEKYFVVEKTNIDYNSLYRYIKDNKKEIPAHAVNAMYIKKISVQK